METTTTQTAQPTSFERFQTAFQTAEAIVAEFSGKQPEDAAAIRKAELLANTADMTKADLHAKLEELADLIVSLEKPKPANGLTVEAVAKRFMTHPDLAVFTWPQVALLIKRVLPEANTSSKSISSYASKHREDWGVVPREKLVLDPAEVNAAIVAKAA